MGNPIYYGPETEKAIQNFGSGKIPFGIILAYAEVKGACISAIQETGNGFREDVFQALIRTIDEIKIGKHNNQFPLPLKQGGAGTSINMNMNEVISKRSMEILKNSNAADYAIDPIEDVNRYQSTNDTFPTALTIFFLRRLQRLESSVITLQEILVKKEAEYQNLLLAGRTEMQSALPITLGQVFSSWAGMIERDRWRLNKIQERFRTMALGGTAIGTGFSAPQNYIFFSEKHLRRITGLPLSRSQNMPDEIAHADKFAELAGGISLLSENLFKITGDLLIYTSSMNGEIIHPNLQWGSSIMAAKVNPVILEYTRGLSMDASHECDKVREYSKNGQLQLNAFLPFLAEALCQAFNSIERAVTVFMERFLIKMEVNTDRMEENLVRSDVLLNVLVPLLGYHRVKELSAEPESKKHANIDEFCNWISEKTELDCRTLKKYLDPIRLTTAERENNAK